MPTQKIRKAVIPAAGLGTRFLPATKVEGCTLKSSLVSEGCIVMAAQIESLVWSRSELAGPETSTFRAWLRNTNPSTQTLPASKLRRFMEDDSEQRQRICRR